MHNPEKVKSQFFTLLNTMIAGALNTTATSIVVKTQELPPPPKLSDFVDARITENTVYETDNNYQRDWLTGK